MIRLLIPFILVTFFSAHLKADFVYFDWTPTGATTGTGSAAEYSATYSLLPAVTQRTYTSDDPAYVGKYGSTMPGFEIDNDSSLSGTFNFSAPLRPGSIMVILDIDRGETISFSSDSILFFIENLERFVSGNSDFPTWNDGTQSISATTGALSNSAATIIDVSGVSQLSFNFSTTGNTGTSISFGVISIPEPGSIVLCGILALGTILKRRPRIGR